MPERIRLSRQRGWRKPAGAVVVSRPSRWGNPFKPGELVSDVISYAPTHPYDGPFPEGTHTVTGLDGQPRTYSVWRVRDRAEAVDLYRIWLGYHDDVFPPWLIRRELGGRDLCCWCPLPEPGEPDICHAAVLIEISNFVPARHKPPVYPSGAKPFETPVPALQPTTDVTLRGGVL